MSAGPGRPSDPRRAKSATTRGTPSGQHELATPTEIDVRRPVEHGTPTEITPARPHSAPLRVISMKTPAHGGSGPGQAGRAEGRAEPPARELHKPRIRALSEVSSRATPVHGMGYLAPPRDPREARSRRVRDVVIWGSLAVILACGVTLAIWFLAR